jgi:hypothetical protein
MTPNIQIMCSFALTFGVPVAYAGWELWRLGPTNWRPPAEDAEQPDPAPLPAPAAQPSAQKPLPDCLIPRPAPARVRELA